jgi:hypothetical protein
MNKIALLSKSSGDTDEKREYTDVAARVDADGCVRFSCVDMGPQIEAGWGDFDLEQFFDVPAEDGEQALLIAQRIFRNPTPSAWTDFLAALEADNISVEMDVWR